MGWMCYRFELDFMGQISASITHDLHANIWEYVGWMCYRFDLDLWDKSLLVSLKISVQSRRIMWGGCDTDLT